MIKYTSTIDSFNELMNLCWSGAIYTLNKIESLDKKDELMNILSDIFYDDESCTLTTINDFLWFDSDYIFELLGIEEEE